MNLDSPIVVGGGGGSGTRVVAMILRSLGVDIGFDLNAACDDLTWTLLFKRPWWKSQAGDTEIGSTVECYSRLRQGRGLSHSGDTRRARQAAAQWFKNDRSKKPLGRARWIVQRYRAMSAARSGFDAALWGWKEPNSHIYLPELIRMYPGMRYIHLMRHGLDMAYSTNQQQHVSWGREFGVESSTANVNPTDALRYWVRSNERACQIGCEQLGDRFLVLRFEDICDQPCEQINAIASFVGVTAGEERVRELAELPQSPGSRGRFLRTVLMRTTQVISTRCSRWVTPRKPRKRWACSS